MAIKITRTEQGTSFDGKGSVLAVYRVYFTVGEHGPFVEEFSRADFIPENVRQRTEAVAATIRAVSA